jgi:hypothetical protein
VSAKKDAEIAEHAEFAEFGINKSALEIPRIFAMTFWCERKI